MILPILSVKDIQASIAFYRDQLGFKHDFTMDAPDGTPNFAFVSLGQAVIGLSLDQELTLRGQGVDLMIYVPDETDIDDYYKGIESRGVKIDQPIADQYWGDRTFVVHDPDGYLLTIAKTVKQMSFQDIAQQQPGE